MSEGRIQKSKKNIVFGLIFQVLYLVFTFVKRLVMLKTAGLLAVSLNQLLIDVIAVMEIADLGVWQAMTYHLYKPLAEGDEKRIASLMLLFKRAYQIIGGVIFAVGLAFLPFSHVLLKDVDVSNTYFHMAYFLVLLKVAIPYFGESRTALMNADQKSHKYMRWHILIMIAATAIEIAALYLTNSLLVYLVIDMVYNVLLRVCTNIIARKEYPYLKGAEMVEDGDKKVIFANIKRTFISKISNKVLNQTDNILISTLVSTLMVGIYAQYSMFTNGFLGLFAKINGAIAGSIGNVAATETKEYKLSIYDNVTYAFFVLALFVSACFYSAVGPFIIGIIGKAYTVNQTVLTLVTANLFLEIVKMPLWTFFDASGYFKFDQIVALIACVINLIVSIILGKMWGMTGIFLGTMISLLFMMITKIIYFFSDSERRLSGLLDYMLYMALFAIAACFAAWVSSKTVSLPYVAQFFINAIASGAFALVIGVLPFIKTKKVKYWKTKLLTRVKSR